jgi:hypothetical protein
VTLGLFVACNTYDETLLLGDGGTTPAAGSAGKAASGGSDAGGDTASSGAAGSAATDGGAAGSEVGNGGTGGSAGGSGGEDTGSAGSGGANDGQPSLVDDFDDGDFHVEFKDGRRGDWYVANDGSPDATMSPGTWSDIPSSLDESDPRAPGFALHAVGSGFATHATQADNWGALVGCNLDQVVTTKYPYDASAYCALRFSARGSFKQNSSNRSLHVRLSDQWTIPDADNCGPDSWPCNAHAGEAFVVPEVDTWTTFEFALQDLVHPSVPDHTELDKTTLYSIEFTFEGQGEFDVWIDDLMLVTCSEP